MTGLGKSRGLRGSDAILGGAGQFVELEVKRNITYKQIFGFALLACLGGVIFCCKEDELILVGIKVTNQKADGGTFFEISNESDKVIKLDEFCTLYWTNFSGVVTNGFYRHRKSNVNLKPGDSIDLILPAPRDANLWQASFTYHAERSWVERLGNILKGESYRNSIPPDDFYGGISPLITNANLLKLSTTMEYEESSVPTKLQVAPAK
jgi:hypothetical protein